MNGKVAEEMLAALGELLEREGFESVDLLICGGMALVLQRFSTRPTSDIDSLGTVVEQDGGDVLAKTHALGGRFGRWFSNGFLSNHTRFVGQEDGNG